MIIGTYKQLNKQNQHKSSHRARRPTLLGNATGGNAPRAQPLGKNAYAQFS